MSMILGTNLNRMQRRKNKAIQHNKKYIYWLVGCFAWLGIISASSAGEGLWLPSEQPELAQNIPLGAVVQVGSCSGVFVSSQGLVLTSSHCLQETLQQYAQTTYQIDQGFLAQNQQDELAVAPDLWVQVTEQFDITHEFSGLSGSLLSLKFDSSLNKTQVVEPEGLVLKEAQQWVQQQVQQQRKSKKKNHSMLTNQQLDKANELIASCELQPQVVCEVLPHYDGQQYLLAKRHIFQDVRLVYIPPLELAKTQGMSASHQWPRFDADFALLRVYQPSSNPKKSPQAYQPVQWTQFTQQHLQHRDSIRVVGYPQPTQRFRTAHEMQHMFLTQIPREIHYLDSILGVIKNHHAGAALEKTYERASYRILKEKARLQAQLDEYQHFGAQRKQEVTQERFLAWMNSQTQRELYAGAWWHLQQELQESQRWMEFELWWHFFQRLNLPQMILLQEKLHRTPEESVRYQWRSAKMQALQQQYIPELEQALFIYLVRRYTELPTAQQSQKLLAFFGIADGVFAWDKVQVRAEQLYQSSFDFTKLQGLQAQTNNPDWEAFPELMKNVLSEYRQRIVQRNERMGLIRPPLADAFFKFSRSMGRLQPANASRTLRISEGQVRGFHPLGYEDPHAYQLPMMYLDVLVDMWKGQRGLPQSIQKLTQRAKQFGRACFSDSVRRSVAINYLSNADGATGSVGSPTFDGEGRLAGIVYDTLASSTMSDWLYVDKRHRLIHLDIHYVVWLLAYYEQADELLAELGVSKRSGQCRL